MCVLGVITVSRSKPFGTMVVCEEISEAVNLLKALENGMTETSLCQSWWMCVLARPQSGIKTPCQHYEHQCVSFLAMWQILIKLDAQRLPIFVFATIPTANSGTDNWHRRNCLLIEVFPLLIQHCFVHWCWQRFLWLFVRTGWHRREVSLDCLDSNKKTVLHGKRTCRKILEDPGTAIEKYMAQSLHIGWYGSSTNLPFGICAIYFDLSVLAFSLPVYHSWSLKFNYNLHQVGTKTNY